MVDGRAKKTNGILIISNDLNTTFWRDGLLLIDKSLNVQCGLINISQDIKVTPLEALKLQKALNKMHNIVIFTILLLQ